MERFILSAALVAGDDEEDDRAKAIATTEARVLAGENVTGLPTLKEILGEKTINALVKWLQLDVRQQARALEVTEVADRKKAAPIAPVAHNEVLIRILDSLEECNFSKLPDAPSTGDLKQKHFVVLTIKKLLEVVRDRQFALVRKNDFIFVFNGQYWREIDRDTLKDFLGKSAERLGVPTIEAEHYEFKDKLYKQFLAAASFEEVGINGDRVLINLRNGTFEIGVDSQTLREFRAEDFLKHQLGFEFDKNAEAPMFKTYLNRVLPEKELQNLVAEFFGYVFTRRLKLEKALLLYGSGANGKSVLFDVMNALLGTENTANYSLADLLQEHNRAQIAHKLLNYGSEMNASVTRDVFKNLVSGEPIMARLKYGNSFLMENYAKLCFNCNELPKDIDRTDAYFRRLLIIPFRVKIPDDEQDAELAQKIIATELSGVFNWVLAGLQRLLTQRRFSDSPLAAEVLKQYRKEADSVAMFTEEKNYIPSPEDLNSSYIEGKSLYRDYRDYCAESGYKSLGRNNFNKGLAALGFAMPKKEEGIRVYYQRREK